MNPAPPETWKVVEGGDLLTGPIRPLNWEDEREVNCVRKSWVRSMRMKPAKSKYLLMSDALGGSDFWQSFPELRERLMRRADVRVATSPSGATVLGWACVEPARARVHYVFVQEDFRRAGLARQLIADLVGREDVFYTHWTYAGDACPLPQGWRRSFLRAVV